jgi:ribose transport system ATP-binding protein
MTGAGAAGIPGSFAAERLGKSFGPLAALRDVSLSVSPGQVHAVMGANGSGKSTLVKVITGAYRPDRGRLLVSETAREGWASPVDARQAGIAVVHQEAPLIGTLSLRDMIALHHGWERARYGRIYWRRTDRRVRDLLAAFDLRLSTSVRCSALSDAERATVALALALGEQQARLLVLDEATAAISADESETFLARVDRVASAGAAVLMVTHRIGEARRHASFVTVLSAGSVAYQGRLDAVSDEEIIGYMVADRHPQAAQRRNGAAGGPGSGAQPAAVRVPRAVDAGRVAETGPAGATRPAASREPLVEVHDLSGGRLTGASFAIAAGEILGVCGLPDSGVQDLPLLLSGGLAAASGEVVVSGRRLPAGYGPAQAIDAGIAMLPRDRSRDGAVLTLSMRDNMTMVVCDRYWHHRRKETAAVRGMIETLSIAPPDPSVMQGRLSGGNQQKVILAKWLLSSPKLLVLDDPTYGIDPASRNVVFSTVRDYVARENMCALLLSTEPEQIARASDRVLAIRQGRIAAELVGAAITDEAVARWAAM